MSCKGGCGEGHLAAYARKRTGQAQVVALDISHEIMAPGRQVYVDVGFV
jgi:trans-aconitate methyltransferase